MPPTFEEQMATVNALIEIQNYADERARSGRDRCMNCREPLSPHDDECPECGLEN